MKSHPHFIAFLVWLAVTLLTLFAGLAVAGAIGENTNSGLLGICGPYGPDADLVGLIMLGSFPVGIVAGVIAARFTFRRLDRPVAQNQSEAGKSTPAP